MNYRKHFSDFRNTRTVFFTNLGLFILILMLPVAAFSQQYDLLIKGGHVIDPKNDIDRVIDVGVFDGKIARVADNISASSAQNVVDANGLYVSPGFIDIHAHNFYGFENPAFSDGFSALPPDGFTFRTGVTTIVDAGGAGWREFPEFKARVIDQSLTRVLAFINTIGWGMKGHPWEQNLNDIDPKMTALVANQFPEIVGVKIAHYRGHEWEPYHRTVEAAERADIPVMVDVGGALPLDTLLLEVLRPGDIFTHAYGKQAVVDENFNLRPFIFDALERGIIFDVGHGAASFRWRIAIPAFEQGLKIQTISTDLHQRSANAGMKDMSNVMSKLLNMGMSLQEVILASTWSPANVIKRPDLGHLSEGTDADITVFNVRTGEFGFVDARPGEKIIGNQKLEAELTVRSGNVVWDLNGISTSLWN